MNKLKIKLFFWSFGFIFILITYYLLFHVSVFSYVKEIIYLPYLILLILFLLFFFVGIFSSKIPLFWYSLFNKKNLNDVLTEIELKQREDDIDDLVNKLKKSIDILSKNKYSDISVDYLVKNIGLTKEHAHRILLNIKRLKKLRTLSIFIGLLLSIILYFAIINLSLFSHIPKYILIISASIIFLLFVLEGYLITRMPDSFYLGLINVNKSNLINSQKEIVLKNNQLNKLDFKQKESLNIIKNATKFLLAQNINKESIIYFFSRYDISKETINKFIEVSENEIKKEKDDPRNYLKLPVYNLKSDAIIKLTLSKIHDSFEQINKIYFEVNKLQKDVLEISERQKRLEKISLENTVKFNKNSNLNINKRFKNLKKIEAPKLKELLDKRDSEYDKLISYLYHLFLPYKDEISQNDIFSTLLYYQYPYEVIEDVIQKFKDKKIDLRKDVKLSFFERLVNSINSFYDFFTR